MRQCLTSFDLTRLAIARRDWCSIMGKKLSSSHVLVIMNKYSTKQGIDRQLIKYNIWPATPGGAAPILNRVSQNIIATVVRDEIKHAIEGLK